MPWILLLLISLFSAPSFAVAIPGVTTGTTASQQSTPPPEPDVEQKKAAYGALADVLENDTSRKELIEQLRKAAATPPQETVPTLTPPQVEEQKTVLENVTDVSRHYGEALSSRFAQLYRNLIGSPHKPFNPQTFTAAAMQFLMLAGAVFLFYWLVRLCAWPLYRKMGIGYGLLVAVPIISNQVNVQFGALANVIIMLCITVWSLYLIFHNKKTITESLLHLADRSLSFFSLFIRAFALVWHWLASAYFIVLCFFSLFDPGNSLKFMMGATFKSLAIIGIAAFVSGLLSRWISKTITLSPQVQRNYPELQKRVNSWMSVSLKVARILTVCVAIMLLLNAWSLFDFWNWLHNGAGEKTVDILIRIALILFFSAVGWTLLASLIENRLVSDIHGRPLPSARARTLLTLFRNALAVIISTITIMIVLSEIGVNIAPLLAGAGALGLAISFGSQTLVKDIITGIFIQFENGMNTGDLVTIGPLTGTVERMSIRSVGVRQDTGAYHIIPWSSITTFANFVRGIGSVVANYDVDRHEDADKAKQALRDAVEELMQMEDIRGLVIGEPSFAGIVGLTNTAFTLRVSFTTQPLKQWTVRFALDSMVKKHFDLANVRMPVQTYQVLPPPAAPLPPQEPTL